MYSITVGFSPTLYSVDPMLLSSGNPIKCYEEVLSLQPMCSDFSLNSRTPKPVFFLCGRVLPAGVGPDSPSSDDLLDLIEFSHFKNPDRGKCTTHSP